jgi:hypothetical protein
MTTAFLCVGFLLFLSPSDTTGRTTQNPNGREVHKVVLLGNRDYRPRKLLIVFTLSPKGSLRDIKGRKLPANEIRNLFQNKKLRASDGQYYLQITVEKDSNASFETLLLTLKTIRRHTPPNVRSTIYVIIEKATLDISKVHIGSTDEMGK